MEYLDTAHEEWNSMWEQLQHFKINDGDMLCINDNHCWEYLGSNSNHHNFRHANHPLTGKKEYIYIERIRLAAGWA